MVEFESIAYRLTPFAASSVDGLMAKIPGGEDRCREFIRMTPIQFIPAARARIVAPLFQFLAHDELHPWIPMLTLACALDPDEADVLLDAALEWWCDFELGTASPLMIRFGLMFMNRLNDFGTLDVVEKGTLQKFRSFRSFWYCE